MVGVSVGLLYTCVDALLCWLVPCLFCLSCKYTLRLATLTAYILPPLYTQNTLSLLASKWMLVVLWGVMIVCCCEFGDLQKFASKDPIHHPTRAHTPGHAHQTPQHNKPLSLLSKPLSFSFPNHPTWITT